MNSTLYVVSATRTELNSVDIVLTNERGDQLWRYFDDTTGSRRWKVWAVEPTDRSAIARMLLTETGASYFESGKHIGSDLIIPRRSLKRVAKRLSLDLRKGPRGAGMEKLRPFMKARGKSFQPKARKGDELAEQSEIHAPEGQFADCKRHRSVE